MIPASQGFQHIVIGGGVVGLAIAARLGKQGSTLLIEKHPFLGFETSSRNSEVVHSGIYYPPQSLKSRACITGQRLLYQFADKYGVRYNKTGKWILACTPNECPQLTKIQANALAAGVSLDFVPDKQLTAEPNVRAVAALYAPDSGIVNSHDFMLCLEHVISQQGSDIALRAEVVDVSFNGKEYKVTVQTDGQALELYAPVLVNSGGLHSDSIAKMVMKSSTPQHYKLAFVKGHYVGYNARFSEFTSVPRLLYPAPEPGLAGLGIHLTLNMDGLVRFGPDTLPVGTLDYSFDESQSSHLIDKFHRAVTRYLPSLQKSKLYLDYTGIRPKIHSGDGSFKDFIVNEESARGYPGFVNLIGIESPGLTASLALADHVSNLLGLPAKSWTE